MARITINKQPFDVEEGRPLVEVIKEQGFYISNLCYIDGLPPHAGCRTCVVEVEGARGLPLACSTPVADGMAVRTDTPAVLAMRQEVMAIILANHSDRCLTCHRTEHCKTGEICLRDNTITHRCVTCSKNYRCELQTASDMAAIGRANIEPYLDEARTFYQYDQPPPDTHNPFLEFDPQMCILCSRCVRACDELRHTTAIALAGRGFSTRIAFGAGGRIDESNCDFCGACIDVCPTATLMEAPNKWIARPDRWVGTACTECSIGCTIQLGVRNGRGVIVRPGQGNDVSRNQICVRGRFGYDQIRDKHRLKTGRLVRGPDATDAHPQAVIEDAAAKLHAIVTQHGPEAVGFLGSGVATNEDNYLLRRLAALIGSPHLDSSAGYIDGAVAQPLRTAFGHERLPASLADIEHADALLVIADDLESSHNIAALRIKDAVVNRGAKLVSIGPRASEIDDFAAVVLRAPRGNTAGTASALLHALLADAAIRADLGDIAPDLPTTTVPSNIAEAAGILAAGRGNSLAVICAPSRSDPTQAAAQTAVATNLAIALRGAKAAAAALHLLPADANAVGLREMGVHPGDTGLGIAGMLDAARAGTLKALVIAKDNPILTLPHRAHTSAALEALDLCLVIDDIPTDTTALATHLLPDVSPYAKDGTITTADRQLLRQRQALTGQGHAAPAWTHLAALGMALANAAERPADAASFKYDSAADVMAEISHTVAGYQNTAYSELLRGRRLPGKPATAKGLLPLAQPTATTDVDAGLVLITSRDLYTDREAAALRLPDADRLHRSEAVEIHPRDAADLGLSDGQAARIGSNGTTLTLPAKVTEDVPEGTVHIAALVAGGSVNRLLDGNETRVTVRPGEDGSVQR